MVLEGVGRAHCCTFYFITTPTGTLLLIFFSKFQSATTHGRIAAHFSSYWHAPTNFEVSLPKLNLIVFFFSWGDGRIAALSQEIFTKANSVGRGRAHCSPFCKKFSPTRKMYSVFLQGGTGALLHIFKKFSPKVDCSIYSGFEGGGRAHCYSF